MDLAPVLVGKEAFNFTLQAQFSVLFGLVVLVVAYLPNLNRATREDYAY